jgi:hypothetical protein
MFQFFGNVKVIMSHMVSEVFRLCEMGGTDAVNRAIAINSQLSLFVRDLLPLVPPQFCIDLIATYMRYADDFLSNGNVEVLTLRTHFVELLCDHEHFLGYALHFPISLGNISSGSSSQSAASYKKQLGTLWVDLLRDAVLSNDSTIALRAARSFSDHLWKIDFDARFQDKNVRKRIAHLYLPYLDLFAADSSSGQNPGTNVKGQLDLFFSSLIWIIDNIDEQLVLLPFLRSFSVRKLVAFWNSLSKAATALCNRRHRMAVRRKTALILCRLFTRFVEDLHGTIPFSLHLVPVVDACANFLACLAESFPPYLPKPGESTNNTSFISGFALSPEEALYPDADLQSLERTRSELLFDTCFFRFLRLFGEHLSPNSWKKLAGSVLMYFPQSKSASKTLQDLLEKYQRELEAEAAVTFELQPDTEKFLVCDDLGNIKSATVDKLVESLSAVATASAGGAQSHSHFREVFFLTYRSFMTPYELLQKLILRFETAGAPGDGQSDSVRLRVCNAIKHWVDEFFYDFSPKLVSLLLKFLQSESLELYSKKVQNQLKRAVERKLLSLKDGKSLVFTSDPPKSMLPRSYKRTWAYPDVPFNLLDWPAQEIARQMTLVESEYFRRIEPKECLGNSFAKKNKHELAPNIIASVNVFNLTSRFFAYLILQEEDLRRRKDVLKRIIDIADALRALNNYNGINEIISGLGNAAIYRLKKTWELIPSATEKTYRELEALLAPPYSRMRDALRSSNPPCIPYLGMYLTDLTFIDDGNKDIVGDYNHINFGKRRQIAKVIMDMKQYQQTPYHFEEIPYVHQVLRQMQPPEDGDLFKLSLLREPREKK